ncbi:hypothetical protein EUX98_g5282 [Antrodiella citrinella]|uniref:Uncharacterized protein n=1 Tax=Antrodiella citrinella TaxID=2447956 RepID=A0A4S4MUP2_9APHY|nr:hypothetical protein EUX98_g5282 [Antrodiella citrinella]
MNFIVLTFLMATLLVTLTSARPAPASPVLELLLRRFESPELQRYVVSFCPAQQCGLNNAILQERRQLKLAEKPAMGPYSVPAVPAV